jgi:hypothetical protein
VTVFSAMNVSCTNNVNIENQIESNFELNFKSHSYFDGYYETVNKTGIKEVDDKKERGKIKISNETYYINYITDVNIDVSYDYDSKKLIINENGKTTTIYNVYISDKTYNNGENGYDYWVYQKDNNDVKLIKVIWFNGDCSYGYINNLTKK